MNNGMLVKTACGGARCALAHQPRHNKMGDRKGCAQQLFTTKRSIAPFCSLSFEPKVG